MNKKKSPIWRILSGLFKVVFYGFLLIFVIFNVVGFLLGSSYEDSGIEDAKTPTPLSSERYSPPVSNSETQTTDSKLCPFELIFEGNPVVEYVSSSGGDSINFRDVRGYDFGDLASYELWDELKAIWVITDNSESGIEGEWELKNPVVSCVKGKYTGQKATHFYCDSKVTKERTSPDGTILEDKETRIFLEFELSDLTMGELPNPHSSGVDLRALGIASPELISYTCDNVCLRYAPTNCLIKLYKTYWT